MVVLATFFVGRNTINNWKWNKEVLAINSRNELVGWVADLAFLAEKGTHASQGTPPTENPPNWINKL